MKFKTFFKNLLQIFKNHIFAIVTLLLAFACFAIYAFIPDYSYNQNSGKIKFTNPESFCTSNDGWTAIVDARDSLYCINKDDSLVYAVDIKDFPYENAEIINITFSPDNHIFCHVAVYNEDAYLTDLECIFEIDSTGSILREVVHYDYRKTDNPPSHQVRLMGLHFYDGSLHYLYKEANHNQLMEVNPDKPQENHVVSFASDGFSEIMQCHGTPDGQFLVLKNNGEIGFISYSGEFRTMYKAAYDIRTNEGLFPYDVFMANNKLYMLSGQKELSLYEWNDKDDWNLLLPVKKTIQMQESTDLYAFGLEKYEHSLALQINESIYTLENGNTLTRCLTDFSLPLNVRVHIWLKDFLPLMGIIFLTVGLPSGIGNLMKWQFSLLSKQLISTIPVVFIMLAVVISILFNSMINLSSEDIIKETIAVNEIAATQFDGEELTTITGYESVDNGQIKELNDRLRKFINGNRSDWSKNYNASIFVRTTGEKFVCVANSDESSNYMVGNISTDVSIENYFYESSHTFVNGMTFDGDQGNLQLILLTPIYEDDGNYNAVILLNASQNSLTHELKAAGKLLLLNVTLWVILLIVVITLVAAYNAKSLRKAQNVVSQIAAGDFSTRVDAYSKDEIGKICAGVNHMADRLEEYIEEKDRNVKFYYKFVPEKFRELLHKEQITDLELGDAQSADLSILFCDIRAFSLNSEMMTAKESFDFVNRIYGKAGPIIRKHHGFIDKYIGDAIMALFESADNAVACGIELYQAIVLNPNAQEDFGIPSVRIGVGIHSGMSRIGIVGEEERMSGTVISNTVNLSSRIESLTKRYGAGMIISKDTLDRMNNPDRLSTRYLGMVQVAGVNEISTLYEVLDCLPDEQHQKRQKTKLEFREAVRLFHTGNLQQSKEIFQKICEADPEDIAPQLYIEYIEDKLIRGDTEYNVFHFKNK